MPVTQIQHYILKVTNKFITCTNSKLEDLELEFLTIYLQLKES